MTNVATQPLQATQSPPAASTIAELAQQSFQNIAPFWPLQNLIAVNPLQGFEPLPIEQGLSMASAYFQQKDLPKAMLTINRETIKWLQVFSDAGQATLSMPGRSKGLYAAWRSLAIYDKRLHRGDKNVRQWLHALPTDAEQTISDCLQYLDIDTTQQSLFLTLMLTTLPGWASYVKYQTKWLSSFMPLPNPISQIDYVALRLVITCALWSDAKVLLTWHKHSLLHQAEAQPLLDQMVQAEQRYHMPLLHTLAAQPSSPPHVPQAQWIFCIDVRSEPFRRALENSGDYQTFGYAGFFGVPIQVTDSVTGETYPSCPVLLTPKHQVTESLCCEAPELSRDRKRYLCALVFKRLYQSLKYTFTTPFALAESLGIASGVWLLLRSFAPRFSERLKTAWLNTIRQPQAIEVSLHDIPLTDQCHYAEHMLKTIGLTDHFAPLVVLCGHGSRTQNNAYTTALDCGACGGHHGAPNARVMAAILNNPEVKAHLALKGIVIPNSTVFIAAQHHTTTDEVTLYGALSDGISQQLQLDLVAARQRNNSSRLPKIDRTIDPRKATLHASLRAENWAQVRPEWGLARNGTFIIAPRDLTRALDLDGRAFLHCYDWQQDPDGHLLTNLLTAPLIVAQWINSQYLFSTLDNVAFGAGSKVTHNITGKIGVMQGNASDLMTGLPLQSLFRRDGEAYHEAMRLMAVIYAPLARVSMIIETQPMLQQLFCHGWLKLACLTPQNHRIHLLQWDLTWQHL